MTPGAKEPGGGQTVAMAKGSPISSVNQKHNNTAISPVGATG